MRKPLVIYILTLYTMWNQSETDYNVCVIRDAALKLQCLYSMVIWYSKVLFYKTLYIVFGIYIECVGTFGHRKDSDSYIYKYIYIDCFVSSLDIYFMDYQLNDIFTKEFWYKPLTYLYNHSKNLYILCWYWPFESILFANKTTFSHYQSHIILTVNTNIQKKIGPGNRASRSSISRTLRRGFGWYI